MDDNRRLEIGILLALLANVDLSLYKAVEASHQWRSPRGVSLAIEYVGDARSLMTAATWPGVLSQGANALLQRIQMFERVLDTYDATNLHSEQRRVMQMVREFRESVLDWGFNASG